MKNDVWPETLEEQVEKALSDLDGLDSAQRTRYVEALEKISPIAYKELQELLGQDTTWIQPLGKLFGAAFVALATVEVERPDLIGATLERYQISKRIGAGGIGEVFLATHTTLEACVAIKMPSNRTDVDVSFSKRFLQEAKLAASLKHPHLVRVTDFGTLDDVPFLVMEYIEGTSLAELVNGLNDNSPNIDPALKFSLGSNEHYRWVATQLKVASEAVEFLHSNKIVHRDVKPANLMQDSTGRLVLVDFGLSQKFVGTEQSEDVVGGTPAYMAPELVKSNFSLAGISEALADIYGIGATGYFLLTTKHPYFGSTATKVLAKLRDEVPIRPSECDRRIPPDLEAIVVKAMARNPRDRFCSANDLQCDLRRFLEGRPVTARPVSPFKRFLMLVQRNRVVSMLLTLLAIPLLVLTISQVLLKVDLLHKSAELEGRDIDLAKESRVSKSRGLIAQAEKVRNSDPALSLLLGAESIDLPLRNGEQPQEIAIHSLRESLRVIGGHPLHVNGATTTCYTISSSGKFVTTGHSDGSVYSWKLDTRRAQFEPSLVTKMAITVSHIQYCVDEGWLFALGDDGQSVFVRLNGDSKVSESWLAIAGKRVSVESFAFNSVSKLAVTSDGDGKLLVWDLRTSDVLTPFTTLTSAEKRTPLIAFSPDGKWLIAQSSRSQEGSLLEDSENLVVWRVSFDTDVWPRYVLEHSARIINWDIDANSYLLASACQDNYVRVWDLSNERITEPKFYGVTGVVLADSDSFRPSLLSARFDSNGKRLIASYQTSISNVLVWSVGSRETPNVQPVGLFSDFETADVEQNGNWIIGNLNKSKNDLLGMYLPAIAKPGEDYGELREFKEFDAASSKAEIASTTDGKTIAVMSDHGVIQVYKLDASVNPRLACELQGESDSIFSMPVFSKNNRWLYAVQDNAVFRWDLKDKQISVSRIKYLGHSTLESFLIDDEGNWMITDSGKGDAPRLWNLSTGVPGGFCQSVPIRQSGSNRSDQPLAASDRAITIDSNDMACYFDISEPPYTEHHFSIPAPTWIDTEKGRMIAFNEEPSGTVVLLSSIKPGLLLGPTCEVHVVHLQSGVRRKLVGGPDHPLSELKVSDDGRFVIAGSLDGHAYVWDLANPKSDKPRLLAGHINPVVTIETSPDGNWILTRGLGNVGFFLWDSRDFSNSKTFIPGALYRAAFSPDSRFVATTDFNSIILTDVSNPTSPKHVHLNGKEAIGFEFSKDSRFLAIGVEDLGQKVGDQPVFGVFVVRLDIESAPGVGSLLATSISPKYLEFSRSGRRVLWKDGNKVGLTCFSEAEPNRNDIGTFEFVAPESASGYSFYLSDDEEYLVAVSDAALAYKWSLNGGPPEPIVELRPDLLVHGKAIQTHFQIEKRAVCTLPFSPHDLVAWARKMSGRELSESERSNYLH